MTEREHGKSLSASLKELKETLKEEAELSTEEIDSDTLTTGYARQRAVANVEVARRNLEGDRNNLFLKDWLAFNLYASGNFEEAVSLYRQCLRHDDSNAEQHYYIGNCLYKLGELRQAMEHWRRATELDGCSKITEKARARLESVRSR